MPVREVQQVKKQHPVPQNIMSVEFKLIGDMTIRQFMYVSFGGVAAFILFKSSLPFFVRWIGIVTFGLGGLGMAFVPVQDRGLDVWIRSLIRAIISPTQMVWRKNPLLPIYFLSDYARSIEASTLALAPTKSRTRLYEYLNALKSPQDKDPYEIGVRGFIDKLDFNANLPSSLASIITSTVTKEKAPEINPNMLLTAPKQVQEQKPHVVIKSKEDVSDIPLVCNIKTDRPLKNIKLTKEIQLPQHTKGGFSVNPLYKETPVSENKSKAGETKPKTDKEIQKQIKELKDTIILAKKAVESEKEKDKPEVKEIPRETPAKIVEEKEYPQQTYVKETLPKQKFDEKPKPEPQIVKEKVVETAEPVFKVDIRQAEAVTTREAGEKSLRNVLRGMVLGRNQEVIEGAVLLIKDNFGEPERALKTNKFGEFETTTPLENGDYSVEIKYKDKIFDVINFKADGGNIDPMKIVSKN